jgi:predicted RNA-binding protein with RPS1 domain
MNILKTLAAYVLKYELDAHKAEVVHLSEVAKVYVGNLNDLEQTVQDQKVAILNSEAEALNLRRDAKQYYDLAQTYKAQAENNRVQPSPPPRELSQFDPKKVTVDDLKRQFYGGLFAIPGLEITELKPNKEYNTYLITLTYGCKIREFFVKENLGSDSQNPRLTITEILK